MDQSSGRMSSDSSVGWRLATVRKTAAYLAALVAATGILSLVLASPLLLRELGRIRGIDWTRLSNVGQTYGAASAILSAVALIGISLSLMVQARQARAERIRVVRERHMELLRIILDNPEIYASVIGVRTPSKVDDSRRFVFSTMWMNYSRLGYQMGVINQHVLREEILRGAFRGKPMRDWWAVAGKYWSPETEPDRRSRQFVRIASEEYRRAVADGPPNVRASEVSSPEMMTPQSVRKWVMPVGVAIGVAIGIAMGSRRRYRDP